MKSPRLHLLNSLLGLRRVRRQPIRRRARLQLEQLEDRCLLSTSLIPSAPAPAGVTDPYTLYTYGDSYVGGTGQDLQSFMQSHTPFNPVPTAPSSSPSAPSPQSANDPASPGPFAVMTQEYNLGNLAFRPTDAPWANSGTELTGEIKAPTDLGNTAHPVVVLLHGRHATTYDPTTGAAFLEWPATGTHLPIPSYRGYDYLGDVLASQGYVVVSIGADGINARDNNDTFPDLGMTARAQLMERTFGILQDLNTDGVIRPRPADATHPGTDLFTGTSSPFGTRFVGKLDLQNIGIMGHSRGGEGVVQTFRLNQSLGSPYGIKAVFALAPVDFIGSAINNVPFAVLLPYNDGDVSDLQGAHFFDDSRYNVPGDTGPKFSIEVMGADHNFYNTVWSPGLFPFAGAPAGFGGTGDDGNSGPPTRLTETQEQGTGLAYMSAFFRTYLGGETQFLPILTGDAPPPPSAQVTPDRIHIGYLPAADPADRRDVNRLVTPANLATNTLGGTVVTGGLTTYTVAGPVSGEVDRGNQLSLGYSNTLAAFFENDLPIGLRDERNYTDLQFRIGVNWTDTRNPLNTDQDFSVELIDGSGNSYSVLVSAYSNDLFYPPRSSNPHEVLNTVRIPLSAFAGIDLSNVTAVRFDFDQHNSGAFQIADLAFADPAPAAGPYVVLTTPSGGAFGTQSSVRVQFDRPIDVGTFTTASIDSFTRTVGSTVTDLLSTITRVDPVAGSGNQQFDISFAPQSALGLYRLVLGPNILDAAGNPMDQNHNLSAGEDPDDDYTVLFSIQGPQVIASTPSGNNLPGNQTSSVTLTFNEPIDPSTFTTDKIFAFRGPNGLININSVAPIAGTNNTQFRVSFDPQVTTGRYTMLVGPNIFDSFGHQMDQNGNFIDGEIPGDFYAATFGIQGLQVVSATPNSTVPGKAFSLRVVFNEAVDVSSFSTGAVSLAGPDGDHPIEGVVPVAGSNFTQFDVLFAPLTMAGSYTAVIGPNIADVFGNTMDQDGNLVPGESTDTFTNTFTLTGPALIATTVAPGHPVDHVTLTFDRPMDPSTFSTDSFALTGPSGSLINITGVTAVAGSNATQFVVSFDPSSAVGTYHLTVHAGIADIYGNALADDLMTSFTVQVNYTASATTFQNLEIFGQAGTQTLTFTSGAVTADDDFGTINLGAGNSFTFYGQTYNQLFVSSNGLITFGAGVPTPTATNLAGSPAQPAIAAYWTDLFKSGTQPMIVWRIDNNKLIIEWYRVGLFDSQSLQMTFQAILDLNTGGTPGNIVFNYSSVTGTGDQPENIGVTVGVKDAGGTSTVARTLVEDGTRFSTTGDPRVQTGRAILFTAS